MEIIDLGKDLSAARQEDSRKTISNGIALGHAIMRELIGRELGNNPEINLEDHLSMIIGHSIESAIRG